MSGKKLNMIRVRDAVVWTALVAAIASLLFFSIRRKSNAEVKNIQVEIVSINGGQQLISEKEIEEKINLAAGIKLSKASIKKLNLPSIEAKLSKDKRIERVDLYFDSKDVMHVRIIQRKPVLRVIEEAGADYYLDENGKMIPVTTGNAIRVPIVSGIKTPYDPKFLDPDKSSKMKDIFTIMKYVSTDEFLSSLIEQVYVDSESNGDIVLIPKLGKENLIFGGVEDMEDKFDKLKIFYKDGLPRLGWNRYKTLNLKYTQQIAGTLRDPKESKIKMPNKDTVQVALKSDIIN